MTDFERYPFFIFWERLWARPENVDTDFIGFGPPEWEVVSAHYSGVVAANDRWHP